MHGTDSKCLHRGVSSNLRVLFSEFSIHTKCTGLMTLILKVNLTGLEVYTHLQQFSLSGLVNRIATLKRIRGSMYVLAP